MLERFHAYVMNFPALAAAGGTLQQAFQVENSYRFEMMKLSAFVYDANGLGISESVLPRLGVLLQDGASSQQLTSAEVPLRSIFGTGELPFVLPAKHIVLGGATFLATVFNRHTVTAFSAVLVFSGRLLPTGAPQSPTGRVRRR